ncbi:hypothetical protein UlMin_037154 [Ulmus minor]
MAMQSGMGVSKILVLAGAGYTTAVLFQNGRLSDLLGELQSMVKGLEKKGDQSEGDSNYSDAIASQVRRLAAEVRQLTSSRQITVLNGSEGYGYLSSLIVPAAAAGGLGYGYMWWKGLKLSDLTYVTKRSMENAVGNLTKNLDTLSDALAKTRKQLRQRVQNLDDKVLEQKKLSGELKNDVAGVHKSVDAIESNVSELRHSVYNLDDKLGSLEYEQHIANEGLEYLYNFVRGEKVKMPEVLRRQLKGPAKPRGLLTYLETPSLKDFKALVESLFVDTKSASDAIEQNCINMLEVTIMIMCFQVYMI